MVSKSKFFRYIFILLVLFFIGGVFSCKFINFGGDFTSTLRNATETNITFHSANPEERDNTGNFVQSYRIGNSYSKEDLPAYGSKEVYDLRPGYVLLGWKYLRNALTPELKDLPKGMALDNNDYIESLIVPLEPFEVYAVWEVATDTPYKVYHWLQNLEDDEFILDESLTQELRGTTDALTEAVALDLDGFISQSFDQVYINGTGDSIVNIYYKRQTFKFTHKFDFNDWPDFEFEGRFGAKIPSVPLPERAKYEVHSWLATYDDGREEVVTELPVLLEITATYKAIWTKVEFEAGGSVEISDFSVRFVLEAATVSAGNSIKVKALLGQSGSEAVNCINWRLELYDSENGYTGVFAEKSSDSSCLITPLADWPAGIYYVKVSATPISVINGSETQMERITEYLKVEVIE